MKKTFLSLFFSYFFATANAQELPNLLVLQGTVDGGYEIELNLQIAAAEGNCAKVSGGYMFKSVLNNIPLSGQICKTGELKVDYSEKNKVVESFVLSFKNGKASGTLTKGGKTQKVAFEDVAIKYKQEKAISYFGQLVKKTCRLFGIQEMPNWENIKLPIYDDDESLTTPTKEALSATNKSGAPYIQAYSPGYLEMSVSTLTTEELTEKVTFNILPDAEIPTYIVIWTRERSGNEEELIEPSSELSAFIFQYNEEVDELREITNMVCDSPINIKNVLKYKLAFNMLIVEQKDGAVNKFAWEHGKFSSF